MFWWVHQDQNQDLSLVRNEPILISDYFEGFPKEITKVDAFYERHVDHKIMFFVGREYYLFSANKYYSGPEPISDLGLPDSIDHVDGVTTWGSNGRTYIFTGSRYWRLDAEERQVEADYPRDMTVWSGVPKPIDAVFTWTTYDSKNV